MGLLAIEIYVEKYDIGRNLRNELCRPIHSANDGNNLMSEAGEHLLKEQAWPPSLHPQ